jgi:hypothetical protein
MHFRVGQFVRAFLPAAAMAVCHGCGGGSDEAAVPPPSGEVSPAVVANAAPRLAAPAASYARVGAAYTYQPSATDADGDALKFSAENLPPWSSLDATSGRISGTPSADDVGEYESITITVADAKHQIKSAPFAITVLDPARVATIQWDVPGSKVDGSPLDNLAGYRILYGREADDLDHSVFVADPSATSIEFDALSSGIWYFAVVAVNENGLEGPPSTAAMKSI